MKSSPSDRRDQRAALFGYRLMFSPETQPIKQGILAQIVFLQLAETNDKDGKSIGKLTTFRANGVTVSHFSIDEVRNALETLVAEGLVEQTFSRRKKRWHLTVAGREKIRVDTEAAEHRISTVIDHLFGSNAPNDIYRRAFLDCLGDVFQRLARQYVEALTVAPTEVDPFADADVDAIATEALNRYVDLNEEDFLRGVRRFFAESHPDSDWLKWTYCKNYYSARIVGAGQYSAALSKAAFSGMTVYLDTNVIIASLDSSAPTYTAIRQILQRFRELRCRVAVLRVTIDELRDLARRQQTRLADVLRQIPDALLRRTRGIIANAEASHRDDPSQPGPAEMLSKLEEAEVLVTGQLRAEIIDDDWFSDVHESEEIAVMANALQCHYDQTARFGRHKSDHAAKHDALVLAWVSKGRSTGLNCAFATLDASLPTFPVSVGESKIGTASGAIAVDALLPWLGMVASDDDSASTAYSALLSTRLIGIQQTFDINEFRMLAEIGMNCGQMPAEDVEQCLVYLRGAARGMDLRKAEDREKLHHTVQKFFSSPDRKYLSDISRLESELTDQERIHKKTQSDLADEVGRLRASIDAHKRQTLIAKTKVRLTVVGGILVLGVVGFMLATQHFGAGDNFLQRLGNTWWLLGLVLAACGILARALCRGDMWTEAKRILSLFSKD